jgi:hypothetical protein
LVPDPELAFRVSSASKNAAFLRQNLQVKPPQRNLLYFLFSTQKIKLRVESREHVQIFVVQHPKLPKHVVSANKKVLFFCYKQNLFEFGLNYFDDVIIFKKIKANLSKCLLINEVSDSELAARVFTTRKKPFVLRQNVKRLT